MGRISSYATISTAAISDTDQWTMTDMDATPKVTYGMTIGLARTALSTPSSDLGDTLGTSSKRWSDAQLQKATISATWNAVGTTFTALAIAITDSASAAGSLLADFKVGGASKFTVTKTGSVTIANGLTVTAGAVSCAAGLTVSAGGFTVSASTSALQAVTGTSGVYSSSVTAATVILSTGGFAPGSISKDAGNGLSLGGVTAINNDITLLTPGGSPILHVPTGTRNLVVDVGTLTMGFGTLFLKASTTASASLNIASGAAPTSPNDGDYWYDGTNVKIRVGATTKTFTIT